MAAPRGRSSVGRASPCQGEGRQFESGRPLHKKSGPFPPGSGPISAFSRPTRACMTNVLRSDDETSGARRHFGIRPLRCPTEWNTVVKTPGFRCTSVCARYAEGRSGAHAVNPSNDGCRTGALGNSSGRCHCGVVVAISSETSCVGARAAQGNGLQSRTVAGSNPARRSRFHSTGSALPHCPHEQAEVAP